MADASLKIEIRIGDVPLATKLDALGAALISVREAHRDTMSNKCWAALNRASEAIAEATIRTDERPALSLYAPDRKAGYHHIEMPAGAVVSSAGADAGPQ